MRILDHLHHRETPISEDELYTYDFTLKKSRAASVPKLLNKYSMPLNVGLSKEGVTVRGAPGFRIFRAIGGGAVLMNHPAEQREAWILEAVETVREEVMKVVGQKPVQLPSHVFENSGKFVSALLDAVVNRSNGRVEQALVGAKLQLRFPNTEIPSNPGFAGDRQTGRESDYEVGEIRVLVSVTPGAGHFQSAEHLADEGRDVYLVVSKKAYPSAASRIEKDGYADLVTVDSVARYVTSNMKEIRRDQHLSPHEMCAKLVAEYNRRIAQDRDHSLQVVLPS